MKWLIKLWILIQKYDKISHFIIGMLLFFIPIEIAFAIMVMKEIFDCYKKNPTGFDLEDIAAGMGGFLLGNYIYELLIH
jgi:hypothetical protein